MQRVLVTGMSGLIGGAVLERLRDKYELSALNRRAVPGVPTHQCDLTDFDSLAPAFAGIDTVVHLAAVARVQAPWEEVFPVNVTGTYNIYESARLAGAKRVIFASSGATVSGWERESPYGELVSGEYDQVPASWDKLTHLSPVRPSGLYGVSKVWGEALGRFYCDEHGLSVICLRIGAVLKEDRPTQPRHYSVWLSQRDVVQMIDRCLQATDEVRYDIFFVVSNNRWSYRDVDHAREVVGYVPEDAAEEHRR